MSNRLICLIAVLINCFFLSRVWAIEENLLGNIDNPSLEEPEARIQETRIQDVGIDESSLDEEDLGGVNADEIGLDNSLEINIFDDSHDWIHDYINSVSKNLDGFFIDTFFGDDILEDDVSGSRAKFSFFTRRVAGEPVDYRYGVSVKLVLPHTNKRLNLLLESSENEDGERESDALSTVDNVEYSTALRYIITESNRWKVNFDTGVRWGIPPDLFTRLKLRRNVYFDHFKMRATQTIFWTAQEGVGEKTDLEFNKPLDFNSIIRLGMDAEYMLNNDYFDLSYGLGLYHELNKKAVLAYYLRASGDTIEAATFNNYGVGIRYRRKIYKDWMFAEINPELETASDNEYKTTPILMLRFEALVGTN